MHGYRLIAVSGVVVSGLRYSTLKAGGRAQDPTQGSLNSTLWTAVELNTFIIVNCMTVLKAPFIAAWTRLFGSLRAQRSHRNTSLEWSTPLASIGEHEFDDRRTPSTGEPSTGEP